MSNEFTTTLQKWQDPLKDYAIREYNQDSFIKSARIAIANNDTLKDCFKSEKGKISLYNAMCSAASTGLSLNPQDGKAALVAYKNKNGESIVNYQIMKNGMIDLALESGKIEFLTSDYVRENDVFSIKKSIDGDSYDFQPALKDRGKIIGFFAALKLTSGMTHVKWLTTQEVEEIRDKYSATHKFQKENSAWSKSFSGMGVKTVMKALLRSVSISTELDSALNADDYIEVEPVTKGVSSEEALEKLQNVNEKIESKDGDLL